MHDRTVAENVVARAQERAKGDLQPAKIKTALVIQGGTLRSVASCAAAAALNHLNLTNAFDMVYGASSGAVNGAYFLSNQAALGVTVYVDDVNNRRFLNFFRPSKMIDLEFFFEQIVLSRKRHDFDSLIRHPTELKILTTDLESGETAWFSSKDRSINIYTALKASCALPLVYGRGVEINGRRYIDGLVTEPLPIITPLRHDYTDILVLMTRHISYRQPQRRPPSAWLIDPLIKRELKRDLFLRYSTRWKLHNWAVDVIESGSFQRPDGSVTRIAYICPDKAAEAHKFELNRERLITAAYSSWANTFKLLAVAEGTERSTFEAALRRAVEDLHPTTPRGI
jgi:predicted patatin/cPLA2 family phospholipase